jgi:indole-3-glycerol phosphate synthase
MEGRGTARARVVSLLASILEAKRRDVAALRTGAYGGTRQPLDAFKALSRGEGEALRLVAEIKLRSPSAGPLSRALTPARRALAYARAGATMVSVLCDAPFFDGSWEHLEHARTALDAEGYAVAVLAKDFVIDESQIREARHRGADAILLIARIVPQSRLVELASYARSERVEPFVEVVDERELDGALLAQARIVGVNARDLDTLVMDAVRAKRILDRVPPGVAAVHLSGLREAILSRVCVPWSRRPRRGPRGPVNFFVRLLARTLSGTPCPTSVPGSTPTSFT